MGMKTSKERKKNSPGKGLMRNWKHEKNYTASCANLPHTDMESSEYQCQGEPDMYINACDADEIVSETDSVWKHRRAHSEIFIRNNQDYNLDTENYVAMGHVVEKETVFDGPDDDHYYCIKDRFSRAFSETDIKQLVETTKGSYKNKYLDLRTSHERLHRYEEMIIIFQPLIVQNVIPRHIIPHLFFLDDHSKVRAIAERCPRSAVVYIIDELLKNKQEPGRWKQFIEALKQCEYKYIAGILQGDKPVDHSYQRQYLKIITPVIRNNILPIELSETLWSVDVISSEDKEDIHQVCNRHGLLSATDLLLDRVPRKHKYWFSHLTDALKATGMEDAANMLDIPELQNLSDSSLVASKKLDSCSSEEFYEEPENLSKCPSAAISPNVNNDNVEPKSITSCKDIGAEENVDSSLVASKKLDSCSSEEFYEEPENWSKCPSAAISPNVNNDNVEPKSITLCKDIGAEENVEHESYDDVSYIKTSLESSEVSSKKGTLPVPSEVYKDDDTFYFLPPSPTIQHPDIYMKLSDDSSESLGEIAKPKSPARHQPSLRFQDRPLPSLPVQSSITEAADTLTEYVLRRSDAHRSTHPPSLPSRNVCRLSEPPKASSAYVKKVDDLNVEVVTLKTPPDEIGTDPPFPLPIFDCTKPKVLKPVNKCPVPLPRTKINSDVRTTVHAHLENEKSDDSYEDVEEEHSAVILEDDEDQFTTTATDIKTIQTIERVSKPGLLRRRQGNSMFARKSTKYRGQDFKPKMNRKGTGNPKKLKIFQRLKKRWKPVDKNKDETSSETDDNGAEQNSEKDESLDSKLQAADIIEVTETVHYYSGPFLDEKRNNTQKLGKINDKKCQKDKKVLSKEDVNNTNKKDDLIEEYMKCYKRHGFDRDGIKEDLQIPLSKDDIKQPVIEQLKEVQEQKEELAVLVQQEPVLKTHHEILDTYSEKLKQTRALQYGIDMKKKTIAALKEAPANEIFKNDIEVNDIYDDNKYHISSAREMNSRVQSSLKPEIQNNSIEIGGEEIIHNKADPEAFEKDSAFFTYPANS